MRSVFVFIKMLLELAVISTWVTFVVFVTINDPPLRSIAIGFGLLAFITTIIVAFTRRLRK